VRGAILVSGVPGAGKTTIAHRLATRFPRSVHIEGDLVGERFVVNGLVPPGGEPTAEAKAQLQLRRRNICLLADSFAEAGFLPVIDDVVVSRPVLDAYLGLLATRPLALVQLAPQREVVAQRDADRDKQVFDRWHHLDEELRRELPGVGLWLDTSDLTAEETVAEILTALDDSTAGPWLDG